MKKPGPVTASASLCSNHRSRLFQKSTCCPNVLHQLAPPLTSYSSSIPCSHLAFLSHAAFSRLRRGAASHPHTSSHCASLSDLSTPLPQTDTSPQATAGGGPHIGSRIADLVLTCRVHMNSNAAHHITVQEPPHNTTGQQRASAPAATTTHTHPHAC